MKRGSATTEHGNVELLEEAVHLLRGAPPSVLFSYYLGALPFFLGFLYFWADMSRHAFAGSRLAETSLGLALLFVWMKTWQAIFCDRLLARRAGRTPERLTIKRWLETAQTQAILQPSGLFLLPIALLLLLPFAYAYGFYQSATVLALNGEGNVRETFLRSWRQARLWPMAHNGSLLALKTFALFVFINIITVFLLVPMLLKMLLGIETVVSRMMGDTGLLIAFLLNTTFLSVTLTLTYLCVDPIAKASYVLRCFYGESLQTGEDLKAELRNLIARPALRLLLFALLVGAALPQTARAAEEPPTPPRSSLSPQKLDQAIEEVMERREFTWRVPKPKTPAEEKSGILHAFLSGLTERIRELARKGWGWMKKFLDWLAGSRQPRGASQGGFTDWGTLVRWLIVALAIALVAMIGVLLYRMWQRRRVREDEILAEALPAAPDIRDDTVGAEELPEDGWMTMARDLISRGELRLGLRALYLASLAHLAQRQLITLAKFKSNRDYERELARRAHALANLPGLFAENVTVFDRVWYGLHDVTTEMVAAFEANVHQIRGAA